MSTQRGKDWARKLPGVTWGDVYQWVAEVRDTYGLWVHFRVVPPLPCRARKDWGTVVLVSEVYRDGGMTQRHLHYRTVPLGGAESVEQLALSLIAQLSKQLDSEVWEAERASGQGALPF